MKIKYLFILLFLFAFKNAIKAQTVTDPWATLGASNIQTSFIAMDASNNLYVTNFINSTISKITPGGIVTQAWATLAGNSRPYGMVIDPSGILYTVNRGSPSPYTISKITPTSDGSSGTVIQTWANLGTEAYTISMDASGNLYAPFVGTNQIAKIVPAVGGATGIVTKPWVTLASGANPFSISFDAAGNLYSANSNNTISKITPAGSVTPAWATLAAGSNPQFSVFDPAGNLYVSCWGTSTVSKINSSGTVTDVWSLGTSVWPAGIVLDANGNIFTANYNNHTVSKITSSGTVTQAFASLANGSYPFHLAKDTGGNLYTTNMGNGTVSKISYVPQVSITSSASGAVCAGTNVTFTATTQNFTTPTYQWYKNGTAISGETNATYTTTLLSNNDQISVRATPATVSATKVTSNLIANLDAGNSSSYNGSGNIWTDLTGNGNNVTLSNAGYSSVNGGGIALNTNGYGTQTLTNSPFNGDFTWSTIFRFNDGIWDWIYNVGGYNGLVLTTLGKPALSWGGWFNNKIDAGAEVALTNGNYYMLTFVRSGNAVSCYLQASPYGIGSNVSGNISLVSPLIGKGPGGEAWPNGIVNLILLYNRALTQSEITQNYNTYAARFGFSAAAISSNTITTTISSPQVTITSSASGAVCAGTAITFTATVCGIPTPIYQWYKNNAIIVGANASTYSTTTLSNNDQIKVYVNGGINNANIVSNGLLLNLDASNPGSYSGTGNTWYDLSGNNKHGTLMNNPTYDAVSGSIVTNGTNQYISIPQVSTANTNITMQAWVYVNLNTTGTFIKNGTGGGGYSIGIGNWAYDQVGSNVVMLLYGRGWIGSGVSYATAGWKLVTLTLDGSSTARAYVNGSLIGTYTWPIPTAPSGPLNLGANIGDGNIYYNGKFAAAYFYNRELSLAEIQQNYNAFATKTTAYNSNTIAVSVTGSVPTISVIGDACANKTTLSTTSGLTSYTWYKDNVAISGATTNTYVPITAGGYKVEVSNGSCTNTSAATTIYTCGVTADGKMSPTSSAATLVSNEGAVNFGTGINELGSILNTTSLTTLTGTIGATTAVLGGVIAATNAITPSIGVIYSTDINFATYSTANIQSNAAAGTYTSTISGLSSLTTYYAKAFITNKAGTFYGNVVSFTTTAPPPPAVGDSYGGGKVFYVFQPGDPGYVAGQYHGLIAATSDTQGYRVFGCRGGYSSGTSTALGTGAANTTALIAGCSETSTAAKLARAVRDGGYSDWYLPSKDELNKLYLNKNLVGNFINWPNWYWSSSEVPDPTWPVSYNAWYQDLSDGSQSNDDKNGQKGIRAIRTF